MGKPNETELYPPIKAFLEAQGFAVKGEVGAADVMALRGDEDPLLVELKSGFSLTLLQQAVARQTVSDCVYVAVPRWTGKAGYRAFKGNLGLCKRLGLGVFTVRMADGLVELHHEPRPFQPRKNARRRASLIAEFKAREGDPNLGGAPATAGRMTAYRQDAQRCADYLAQAGHASGAEIKSEAGVARATAIMAANHYGWFVRQKRGVYALTEAGQAARGNGAAPLQRTGKGKGKVG